MYRLATLAAVLLLTAPTLAAQGEASYESLGVLSRTNGHYSWAFGVSADGSVAVGYSSHETNASQAFRWENGEMTGLENLPGGTNSRSLSVSDDGSVVVGQQSIAQQGQEAVRWVDGAVEGLGHLEGGFASRASSVSADGSTIVGRSMVRFPNNSSGREAFRWTGEEGMIGLGDVPGGDYYSHALAVSPDGSIIAGLGSSSRGSGERRNEVVRWVNGEMEVLEGFPDGEKGVSGMTPDGSVVVGAFVNEDGSFEAYRWTEETGAVGLGFIEGGGLSSAANGVSADGSVVVGSSGVDTGTNAFIWTEEEGMRSLEEVLENEYGVDMEGWWAGIAIDVSDDGDVIVGVGNTPDGLTEAFRAVLGKPVADEATPEALADVLGAPSPNPARDRTTFTLAVERGQEVAVEVFDALGRHVETLFHGALATGMSETLTLDASALPPGVYVIRATGEEFTKSRRVTVVR